MRSAVAITRRKKTRIAAGFYFWSVSVSANLTVPNSIYPSAVDQDAINS
jgi:hypothetical protein